ncbi:D-2-hydroxyacid dehydrogenase family protein [Cognatishimia sp. D5M38]|uniref:D-2-hydroxyacid dehydrogenase family protein n=1 Tax=Cognatishimia coralii TaxID=3083254 RepID=A0ABU8QI90_9RHOB
MKVAVLDDWFDTLRHLPCYEHLQGMDVTVFTDHEPDEARLAKRLAEFDAITLFRERTPITAGLLASLPKLRLISQRSVFPHVDVEACTKNGVLLCSNMKGGTPPYAAAEHTWALIMAAMRQLPQQMQSLREGNWQIGVGKTLHGRTLGLYGYGRIAKVVAGYAEAFGMNVVWWGSDDGRARAASDGRKLAASREAFFAQADLVSIHVRLKPETRGLITAQDLAAMRETAVFVNTSRAGLVEPDALVNALNAGKPGFAALDVFDQEPITWADDPLAAHPKVTATPHIGFVTEDELNVQFDDIFRQVKAFENGAPLNMINPEVLH